MMHFGDTYKTVPFSVHIFNTKFEMQLRCFVDAVLFIEHNRFLKMIRSVFLQLILAFVENMDVT